MSTRHPEKDPLEAAPSEEQTKRAFSARLRRLREDRGQTQSQVAKALGFQSESVYQLWEKGVNLPSAFNLQKLALYFAIPTDALLSMPEGPQEALAPEEKTKIEVFSLAMKGKNWDAPEVLAHLRSLGRLPRETLEECYDRILTDVLYSSQARYIPPLTDFYTGAAKQAKEEIERRFKQRPSSQARQVSLYVLDLGQVPSKRMQQIILGMQGAELIKQRRANFTLAFSNGHMAREVIRAHNLKRGDIQYVRVIPLTLGMSQSDASAATTLISNFAYDHQDYGVEKVYLKDENGPHRINMLAGSIDLAFMGIGTVEPEDGESLFARLMRDQGIDPYELRKQGVIGNVLFHFIREDPTGPTWEIYDPPDGKRIRVDIEIEEEPDKEDILHTISLSVLRELVEFRQAQIVVLAMEPSRARIVRAALEMRWANSVICTLPVAQELLSLLGKP
jgi:transcriptional regulator with XRE-family HTH domain